MSSVFPALAGLHLVGPAVLPPRDPRFVHGPTELCQLARTWSGRALPPLPWVMEEKVDGVRMLWVNGAILTRKGELLTCAEHIRPELERLERRAGRAMVFDGEYQEPGGFLSTLSALKRGEGKGLFTLFDAMPEDEWRAGGTNRPLWQRRAMMQNALGDWTPDRIMLAPQRAVDDVAEVQTTAEHIWSKGGEGLVLKQAMAPYVRGRRPSWLKVKRELKLKAVFIEWLKDGSAARIEHAGRRLRVAVPPPFRGKDLREGQVVDVVAMEWTEGGQLRQGRLVEQ